jgi:hypothetical protein
LGWVGGKVLSQTQTQTLSLKYVFLFDYDNMAEMQILQDIAYTRLVDRVKEYENLQRMDGILARFSFAWVPIWLVISLTLILPLIYASYVLVNVTRFLLLLTLSDVVAFVPVLLYMRFGGRKLKKADLEDDEWVRFYSGSIVINLEESTKRRDDEKKEEFKRRALKNAYDLLSFVEGWRIGNFLPVKLLVGDSVSDLEKNLKTRIIPALAERNDEDLAKVNQIMYQLFAVSRVTLKIEDIKTLNIKILDTFPTEKPFKIGLSAKFDFLTTHKILKHTLVVLGFLGVSIFSGYVSLLIGMKIDTAGIIFVTLLACLLVVYYTRQPKAK